MAQDSKQFVNKFADFDFICVGTSPLMSLEAAHLASLGKKVLMVDQSNAIGGAWKSIELAGIKDIENAIHYFLSDELGISYMRDNLRWPIELSKKKYKSYKLLWFRHINLPYNSFTRKFFDNIISSSKNRSYLFMIGSIVPSFIKTLTDPRIKSYYTTQGSVGIIGEIKKILKRHNVKIELNSRVSEFFFSAKQGLVHCKVNTRWLTCKTVIIAHGSRLPRLLSEDGLYSCKEKFHPRPAFHLAVEDEKTPKIFELIFEADPIIKYVHNVSRFSSLKYEKSTDKKVFVFALQSDVEDFSGLTSLLVEKLQSVHMLGQEIKILGSRYSKEILPTLYDEDLDNIKRNFGELVSILYTENFSKCIGQNAGRWNFEL